MSLIQWCAVSPYLILDILEEGDDDIKDDSDDDDHDDGGYENVGDGNLTNAVVCCLPYLIPDIHDHDDIPAKAEHKKEGRKMFN